MSDAATLPAPGQPLVLPRVAAGEMRRQNTLVGLHREFAFTWAGKPAALRFGAPGRQPATAGWLRVQLGDHSFDLSLPALPEPASLGAGFAGIELVALPEELLLGVLEAWLEDAVAALQRHSLSFHVAGWRTTDAPSAAACGWEIAWAGQPRSSPATSTRNRPPWRFSKGS